MEIVKCIIMFFALSFVLSVIIIYLLSKGKSPNDCLDDDSEFNETTLQDPEKPQF